MRTLNAQLTFSPSDLTSFHESPFASWMERLYFSHRELAPQPDADDSFNLLLQDLGDRHERAQLRRFIDQGLIVSDILYLCKKHDFELAHQTTLEQMRLGVDVIFQAALKSESFAGFADFLVKVPGASLLGDYHYEVWDTKLASDVRVKFVLQLCCYAEMLQQLQGCLPEEIAVVPGRGNLHRLLLSDYFAYYQQVKTRFLQYQAAFHCDAQSPDPFESREYGRWSQFAEKWLEENDHLSLTANITRRQIKKLNLAGIHNRKHLVEYTENTPKGLNTEIFQRLQQQARLQLLSQGLQTPRYELLPAGESGFHPLSAMPASDTADLYFDLEGFPLLNGGLEYLWGIGYLENGDFHFKGWWAHDEQEEKQALQGFVLWAYQRWLDNPAMHIYHYGHYEITALRRLMGKYGQCEFEIDNLLRNQVFVDLYQITRNSLRIGEPKYSIKNVEHLYRPKRDTDVASGGDSLVEYQLWRDLYSAGTDSKDPAQSAILQKIWLYNRDDCESTWQLAHFLVNEAQQHQISPLNRPVDASAKKQSQQQQLVALREKLLLLADNFTDQEKSACETMAWLVEFYQREKKPVFWRIFDLAAKTENELLDEADVIAGCRVITQKQTSTLVEFDPEQELQRPKAAKLLVIAPEINGFITVDWSELNIHQGQITLHARDPLPPRFQLLPYEYVNAALLEAALQQEANFILAESRVSTMSWKLLTREKPALRQGQMLEKLVVSEDPTVRLQQIIQSVALLNNSFLTIQGPPGTGKTYTGARIIASLVKSGKKIAITANSHKALQHLLVSAKKILNEEAVSAEAICVHKGDNLLEEHGITIVPSNAALLKYPEADIVGATVFALAKSEFRQHFDYLFVDEAGQVSLANLLAMAACTNNIVLLGDQMQLGQPRRFSS